jgi:SAM-dependent methyltransferase
MDTTALDRSARRAAQALRRRAGALVRRLRPGPEDVAAEEARVLDADTYRQLYEAHAQALPADVSIGGGEFEHMGKLMFSSLVAAGLDDGATLVDFGCGTGRLAMHAIPYLSCGRYIGTDISPTMLQHAQERTAVLGRGCRIEWQVQRDGSFELPDASVDMFAAFSVFTHMEHEDTYLYLCDARRACRPGGRFVFSCLTMDLPAARDVFTESASHALAARWERVRNVTTSYDLMDEVAALAGWRVVEWHPGSDEVIPMHDDPAVLGAIGQSICVLERD